MRFIVPDKNVLRRPEAKAALNNDPDMAFVLTDFSFIEAMNGKPSVNLSGDLNGLAGYWERVFIAKSICDIHDKSNSEAIDYKTTEQFRAALHDGIDSFRDQFLEGPIFGSYVASAQLFRNNIKSDHERLKSAFVRLEDGLDREERRQIKSGVVSNTAAAYLYSSGVTLTRVLLRSRFTDAYIPISELKGTFEHRFSLALVLLMAEELEQSGNRGVSPEVMINNVFDMTYVAFGTFFSGVLSNETKVKNIAEGVNVLLQVSEHCS